ncbi:MAG: F0F1 ATP synthase subunit delta, partial [Chloroflexota bacterium]|nr:F0F1 ATP synthase subunit delta [Chloroflexota bacterium]
MNKETAPYVQAVLETALEPWLKSLRQVERRLRDNELVAAVDDISVPLEVKKDRLRPVLGEAPMSVVNLVYTLAGAGDLHLLERLVADLELHVARAGCGVLGLVRSAVPLTSGEKARLEKGLVARFGEELALTYEVDPSIIGGLVVRVG